MRPIVRRSATRIAALAAATTLLIGVCGIAPASANAAKRPMRIAVVLLRPPGSAAAPASKASVQSSVFGASNSVANWFSEMSGGQVAVTGAIYGYYTGVNSCDLATELAAAGAAAAHDGYVASDYDHLVVYAPDQGCTFAGMGWIGASGVFLNGTVSPGVIEHELGHNLGLKHAGAYGCGVAPVSAGCLIEYGDTADVMGNPSINHGFSAEHKYMLGWIPASEVRTVTTGTATIALTASENPLRAGSTELIHVRAADGTWFAIDRRASVGYDAGIKGVWIRQVASVKSDDTELLTSRALPAGETYVDAAHKVTIETLTDSGSTASVRVCVGPCVVSASAQSLAHPGPVTARNIVTAMKTSPANAVVRLTVPPGHGVAAGHTVIVSTVAGKAGGSVSCSDSGGNVYGVNVNSVGGKRLIVCSAHARTGLRPGATITIRYPMFNGSTVTSANDISGIRAVARADRTSVRGAGGAGGVAIDSGTTVRTRSGGEVVFGVVIHSGTATFRPSTGYVSVGAVVGGSGTGRSTISPEFKVVSSIGAFKLAGTLSSAHPWRAAVVTFFRG